MYLKLSHVKLYVSFKDTDVFFWMVFLCLGIPPAQVSKMIKNVHNTKIMSFLIRNGG